MQRRDDLLLGVLALLVYGSLAWFQQSPGYMDADYYFVTGQQIASGQGFTQPFIWNYLDDPRAIPHPSHSYWMPLASLVAAVGMALSGQSSFVTARLGFVLASILLPLLTARLAFRLGAQRPLALASGFLALLPPYLAAVFPTTDNFSLLALLGVCYFLLAPPRSPGQAGLLGLVCGLMTLARSDAILWMVVALAGWLAPVWQAQGRSWRSDVPVLLALLAGYGLVMGPWFARNLLTFGVPMAPGANYLLWMLEYNEIFVYPASQLTMERFWAAGLGELLADRWWALQNNLGNAIAVQGGILLFPFILAGWWKSRHNPLVRLAGLAWLLLLAGMTILFPFAGARGGYFHAGAAFQPLWWALAPLGLESVVAAARRRGFFTPQAFVIFRGALVVFSLLLGGYLAVLRLQAWHVEPIRYADIEVFLQAQAAPPGARVMVANPPAFYQVSNRPGVVMPEGGLRAARQVADQFEVRYLILEQGALLSWLKPVYETAADQPGLAYLGGGEGWMVYEFIP